MMKAKHYTILTILLLTSLYYYWHDVYVHTPSEAIARANVPGGEVLHETKLDEGLLVFYRQNDEGIGYAYAEKNAWSGWKHVRAGGLAVSDKNQDVSWCWSTIKEREVKDGSDSQFLLGILFGEINNPAITSIRVKANIDTPHMKMQEPLIERPAKIVKTNGTRLWYVITDHYMGTAMKVYAYGADGKLIYIANDWGNEMERIIRE